MSLVIDRPFHLKPSPRRTGGYRITAEPGHEQPPEEPAIDSVHPLARRMALALLAGCGGGGGGGGGGNTAPTAQAGLSATLDEDSSASITLAGSDADGDTLSYAIAAQPANGTVTLAGATATYTPAADHNGTDSFSFTVSDGTATSAAATVALTITAVNDAPVITSQGGAAAIALSVEENTTTVMTVAADDVDSSSLTYALGGGADSSLFTIDATSGILAFVSAPDFENPADASGDNSYELTVSVYDGSVSDSQAVTITVTDVLEGAYLVIDISAGPAPRVRWMRRRRTC